MKKIVCISASNVVTAVNNSASTKTSTMIKDIVENDFGNAQVKILELNKLNLSPCNMCEECMPSNQCQYDSSFNEIYRAINDSDGVFIVCPHYAPIPSKLVIVFEKLEEMFYLNYCQNAEFRPAYFGKPVGIIGHGGMIEKFEDIYIANLIVPISNVTKAIGMKVIKTNNEDGVVFGVEGYAKEDDALTPKIIHDWDKTKGIVKPLVKELMESL